MADTVTNKRIRVHPHETGPYMFVPLTLLDRVRTILQANQVSFWVEHHAVSVDGMPAVVVVNLHQKSDPLKVQELMDGILLG